MVRAGAMTGTVMAQPAAAPAGGAGAPGTAKVVLAAWVILRAGTLMARLAVQAGSVPPAGQLLPGAVVARVMLRPGLGVIRLLVVRVPVTVTVAPTPMSPVQLAPVVVTVRVPEVAVWSPFSVASNTAGARKLTVIPK